MLKWLISRTLVFYQYKYMHLHGKRIALHTGDPFGSFPSCSTYYCGDAEGNSASILGTVNLHD